MANYRQIDVNFWIHTEILEYSPEEKLFYIYLFTNPHVKQCGAYQISIRQIIYETNLTLEEVKNLIDKFENEYKKIKYIDNEIWLLNWLDHNPLNNLNVLKCVLKELKTIKNEEAKKYIWQEIYEAPFEILNKLNIAPNKPLDNPYQAPENKKEGAADPNKPLDSPYQVNKVNKVNKVIKRHYEIYDFKNNCFKRNAMDEEKIKLYMEDLFKRAEAEGKDFKEFEKYTPRLIAEVAVNG